MSYDISYRLIKDGRAIDEVEVGSITYNVGGIMRMSSGLVFTSGNNGSAAKAATAMALAITVLFQDRQSFEHLESDNGWGDIDDVIDLFLSACRAYQKIEDDYGILEASKYILWID